MLTLWRECDTSGSVLIVDVVYEGDLLHIEETCDLSCLVLSCLVLGVAWTSLLSGEDQCQTALSSCMQDLL